MKKLKNFLLALTLFIYPAHPGMTFYKMAYSATSAKAKGKGILLVYTGNLSENIMNMIISIRFELDASVGVRYEVFFKREKVVLSHIAYFYKFSKPYQSVYYNFLTHKSIVNADNAPDNGSIAKSIMETVGKEVVNNYLCTHLRLQIKNKDKTESEEYWMSPEVPGYLKLINILKSINASLPGMEIDGTIFTWGGPVKIKWTFTDKKNGGDMKANLRLKQVDSTMVFPASEFDVPSQGKNNLKKQLLVKKKKMKVIM